jgi:hypothetical protein
MLGAEGPVHEKGAGRTRFFAGNRLNRAFGGDAFRSRESSVNYENRTAVGVAQLVERRSVAPNVAGSIPVSHPNLPCFLGLQ